MQNRPLCLNVILRKILDSDKDANQLAPSPKLPHAPPEYPLTLPFQTPSCKKTTLEGYFSEVSMPTVQVKSHFSARIEISKSFTPLTERVKQDVIKWLVIFVLENVAARTCRPLENCPTVCRHPPGARCLRFRPAVVADSQPVGERGGFRGAADHAAMEKTNQHQINS